MTKKSGNPENNHCKTLVSKKMKTNIRQQYIKNKCLSDFIYSIVTF